MFARVTPEALGAVSELMLIMDFVSLEVVINSCWLFPFERICIFPFLLFCIDVRKIFTLFMGEICLFTFCIYLVITFSCLINMLTTRRSKPEASAWRQTYRPLASKSFPTVIRQLSHSVRHNKTIWGIIRQELFNNYPTTAGITKPFEDGRRSRRRH